MTTPYDQLSLMIPPDLALANKALAVSMQGITNISTLTLPALASASANVQTTYGLPLVNAQTSAVPPASAAAIGKSVGTGTGQNGTIKVIDILGTAAGVVSGPAMGNTNTILATMGTSDLQAGYQNMLNTVQGKYTVRVQPVPPTDPVTYLGYQVIIPGGPGAGKYPASPVPSAQVAVDTAFSAGLIPALRNLISSYAGRYPTQYANLNTNWTNMINQLNLEKLQQTNANLNFAQLSANDKQSIYGLVFALPQYGADTTAGGSNQFIQDLVVQNNFGGESIVATLRQGQTNLGATGIGSNNQVPVTPNPLPPESTGLSPSQYPYP